MTSSDCAIPGSMELEKVTPVWSETVWPSITNCPWLWKPWKWYRPFSSLAKPGVAVISSSIAREDTVAGARAMYDLSTSTWEVEESVSSWAEVCSAVTVTDSEMLMSFRLMSTCSGTAERTSTARWMGWKLWVSTCSTYGLKGTLKNWYEPSGPDVVSALKPVMSFRSWSVTAGIPCPSGPKTRPFTEPDVAAEAGTATAIRTNSRIPAGKR